MSAAFETLQRRALAASVLEGPVEAAGARVQHVLVPGQKLAILTSPNGAKSGGTVDDSTREALMGVGWKVVAETSNLESMALTPANASATSASVPAQSEPDAPRAVLRALAGLGLKSAAHVMAAWGLRG